MSKEPKTYKISTPGELIPELNEKLKAAPEELSSSQLPMEFNEEKIVEWWVETPEDFSGKPMNWLFLLPKVNGTPYLNPGKLDGAAYLLYQNVHAEVRLTKPELRHEVYNKYIIILACSGGSGYLQNIFAWHAHQEYHRTT